MAPKKDDKGKQPRIPTPKPFFIRSSHLGRDYSRLFRWVEGLIASEIAHMRRGQDPMMRMPERVNGKLYLPDRYGVFLVTVTHGDMIVTLLFRLRDLYFTAYHINRIWYHFNDFDPSELPWQSEFSYDNVVQLPLSSSYANLGQSNIGVSAMDFENFVKELWSTPQYLLSGVIKDKLSGPLAFPAVTISEALRFLLFRGWTIGTIGRRMSSVPVPWVFRKYFNSWSTFSGAYFDGKPVEDVVSDEAVNKVSDELVCTGSDVKKMLSVKRLSQMLGVLNNRYVKPIKSRWCEPCSSKMRQAPSHPSKAMLPYDARWFRNKGKCTRDSGEAPEASNVTASLKSAIIMEKPKFKQDDISDPESAKQVLQEDVISPAKFQHILRDAERPGKTTLLYGPPGSGKTHMARAVADENGSNFISICPSDLDPESLAENKRRVAELFQESRDKAPSLILIDEIDSLCGHCGENNGTEASKRIKTELLVQMQDLGKNDGVCVIAATNKPYDLDKTVRQLFDKRIYVQLPDLEARQRILQEHLGKFPHQLTEADFEEFARQTNGFSCLDIVACVQKVHCEVRRAAKNVKFFIPVLRRRRDNEKDLGDEKDEVAGGMIIERWIPCRAEGPGTVCRTVNELAMKGYSSQIAPLSVVRMDVMDVVAKYRPTVSSDDVEQYEMFRKEFGQQG